MNKIAEEHVQSGVIADGIELRFSVLLTDLDNTLYDFHYAMVQACQAVVNVSECGDRDELLTSFLFSPYGVENTRVIVDYLTERGLQDYVIRKACDEFEVIKKASIMLYPRVLETIIVMHHHGIRIGAVTNASSIHALDRISHLGLKEYIDFIITPDLAGVKKPDLGIYQQAIDICGSSSSDICMVGDNLVNDIRPAQVLGMFGVHARYGDRLPSEFAENILADAEIYSFSDILPVMGICSPSNPSISDSLSSSK